jgi:hypothetical protein
MEAENPTQLEGVVDVDAIPSKIIKPVSPIMVEEQEPSPTIGKMDIDPQNTIKYKKIPDEVIGAQRSYHDRSILRYNQTHTKKGSSSMTIEEEEEQRTYA